jgi:CRP/FNR family transcriptional regulator, cyclic AMP receptor protein
MGIRLFEIEPDLAGFLTAEEQEEAGRLALPVLELGKGAVEIDSLLGDENAFAAVLLDGLLLQRLRVSDQVALRLLGPGDIVSLRGAQRSMLLAESGYRAAVPTRIALLGNDLLLAARRWPRLVAGLQIRISEQSERLATQFVICQLPRVDQRLLALMWLLAESWGQVTSVGTTLPLGLTHDVLGELIGARRPTVTLALGELSGRGAIVRQDGGWLLLEAPPVPSRATPTIEEPTLIQNGGSPWAIEAAQAYSAAESQAELRQTVARLQEEHERRVERYRERVGRIVTSRERSSELREQVMRQAFGRRGAPSS